MRDSFRPVFEAMIETANALVEASAATATANQAIARAGEGIKKMGSSALDAKGEHEDLRETVHRLEGLVIQLSTEVRALRDNRPNQ